VADDEPGQVPGGHGQGAHPPGPGFQEAVDGLPAPRGSGGRLRGPADDGAVVQGQHPVLQGGAGRGRQVAPAQDGPVGAEHHGAVAGAFFPPVLQDPHGDVEVAPQEGPLDVHRVRELDPGPTSSHFFPDLRPLQEEAQALGGAPRQEVVRPVLAHPLRDPEAADGPPRHLRHLPGHLLAGGVGVLAQVDLLPGGPEQGVLPGLGEGGAVRGGHHRQVLGPGLGVEVEPEGPGVLRPLAHEELAAGGGALEGGEGPVAGGPSPPPALARGALGEAGDLVVEVAADGGAVRPYHRVDQGGGGPRGVVQAEVEAADRPVVQTAPLQVGHGLGGAEKPQHHAPQHLLGGRGQGGLVLAPGGEEVPEAGVVEGVRLLRYLGT